jgi:hypothetical protein
LDVDSKVEQFTEEESPVLVAMDWRKREMRSSQ